MSVFDKVDSALDFPRQEESILAFWKERAIFQKSLALRAGKPTFVFYEGPPTANGLPHNGHVLTRVMKDIFPRYKTMRGYFVGRKAGWDTHGLPVEVEVEKELRIHGKAAIEAYGVEPFIAKCIDSVFRYTKEWEELTDKIAFWVDTNDAYVTYHKSYVESVWWALGELFNKGLLYQGHKVVWWWAQGGTALSAAEVGQGYKTVDDPSVYVAFDLVDDPKTSLLVWTTTPWTLSSNMYAAIKSDVDYVKVTHGERQLIIAAALREALEKKLKTPLEITETFKGSALVGKKYIPPFALFADEGKDVAVVWSVIAADFVTLDTGTGIVHVAPAFGEDDFDAQKKQAALYKDVQLPLFCAVKPDGSFIDEMGPKYAGRWVKDCDKDLQHELKERGALVFAEQYRHEYPFCVRADQDPLIQYARPAWYIRTTDQIGRAIENNKSVHWMPEHIKEGRMGDFLANNVDWALSRERYWGTPLNVWVCEKDAEHKHAPTSTAEIEQRNPKAFDHFHAAKKANPTLNEHLIVHKPWIDAVTFPCPTCGATMRRVTEVIDCWFDSGCMPFAQWGFPHVLGSDEKLRSNFPADFICEAIDQTRGWFYSLLMISTMVFDEKACAKYELPAALPHPYKTCVVLGHVGDKEGRKESKSRGNYTPPDIVYGQVKMDFAVMDGSVARGKAFVAQEDLDGLDIQGGAKVEARGTNGASLTIEVLAQKGLRRRVVVMHPDDQKELEVQCTTKTNVMVAEVPRLPKNERVTLVDPSTPAPGSDAFRWFFFASSPPWSNTRHSLANVRSLQKEFLVKLRNTYAFFTIYANIDGYDPAKPPSVAAVPSELDRWIESELQQCVASVTKDLDGYDVYAATQRLVALVDALSNWYVRRSRDRFWRSGWDGDKRAAYDTLYKCLVTLSRVIAPFVPYTAEVMHQNLARKAFGAEVPESVHLCDWPAVDDKSIDTSLSRKMKAARDLVSLGLQVRTIAKLKVRQPLRTAHVILSDPSLEKDLAGIVSAMKEELNVLGVHFVERERAGEFVITALKPNFRTLGQKGLGKEAQRLKVDMAKWSPERAASAHAELLLKGALTVDGVTLEAADVEVAFTTREGFAAAGDRTGVIVLETTLDDELRELGFLRELQSKVQAARKELGLEFTDRITLGLSGGPRLDAMLAKYKDELAKEVLATAVCEAAASATEVSVEGEAVRVSIAKA
mgnify:CR=1 FL=1